MSRRRPCARTTRSSRGSSTKCVVYYVAANGDELENEGERRVLMTDTKGNILTNVNKVLGSVGEICRTGQQVVFNPPGHPEGSFIHDLQSGLRTPLREEGGTYKMDVWVNPLREATSLVFPGRSPSLWQTRFCKSQR